jgi:hypothetical protein
MTHALLGCFTLNLYFLVAGLGILWGLRGWRSWGELIPFLGIAYVAGLAAVVVLATIVLVAGGGLSTLSILLVSLCVALVGVATGVARRRPRPRGFGMFWRPQGIGDWAGVMLGLLTAALLVAFFRVGRTQPLFAWDAWLFWIPKAKAIYFFGGLDEQLFRSLAAPSYPLFVPALDAMNFRFMGRADTTTLNVQYWLLFCGFLWAAAGLLRRLAAQWLVWLFLATAVVLPQLSDRLFLLLADWPLDMFFALAVLALVCWLETGERWLLGFYTLMVAAMLATKREGQILACALVIGALVATVRRRSTWLPIVGLALLAVAVNVPWRLWWMSRGLVADTPDGGLGNFRSWGRIWPGLHLVLELLFSYKLWLLPVPVAIAAATAALGRRRFELPVLYLVTTVLIIVGFAWVVWSDPRLPISTKQSQTPIPRAVGSIVLMSTILAPLLLQRLLASTQVREPALTSSRGVATTWEAAEGTR